MFSDGVLEHTGGYLLRQSNEALEEIGAMMAYAPAGTYFDEIRSIWKEHEATFRSRRGGREN